MPTKLYQADFVQHVHAHFRRMRDEAPVHAAWMSRFQKVYLVTRYDDVLALLSDPRIVKNPRTAVSRWGFSAEFWVPKSFRPLLKNMLNQDEPDHRRLRNLVHQAFTPRRIEGLRSRIEAISAELIANVAQKLARADSSHPIDFVAEYALPLPVTVIAELIGIPAPDRPFITRMTDRLMVAPTMINMLRAAPTVRQFIIYARKLAQQRRQAPQDDLMTALVQAEADGDSFTEDELIAMVFLLTVAGHETTVGLITNAVLALLENPAQRTLLKQNPDLMDSAIEEFLRYDGPLSTTELSYAKTEVKLHGVTIPQGAVVMPAILSANRDERYFEDPDVLDIRRTPNKHLAFGHGIHYCLGAPLARLETAIAVGHLLDTLDEFALAVDVDALRYKKMFVTHRPTALPIRPTS